MRRVCRVFLATTFLCGWVIGCATKQPMMTKQPKPPPPDPLLMSKKPIEGKPRASDWEPVTRFDPNPPPPPAVPSLPAGQRFASPDLQRDPVSGAQLSLQPSDTRSPGSLKPTSGK